jgi:hypothetical protein
MPVTFVTGSFLDGGFFVSHPSQEHVDSGLPEWTLGDDGTPPSELTEHDGENDDGEHGGDEEEGDENENADDEIEDEGYDADYEDDGDYDDDDGYDSDYEYFLSTLPVVNSPTLDEPIGEEDEENDSSDSSDATPPLDTDSGTWTLDSDGPSTSDESIDSIITLLNSVAIRPATPDLQETLSGLPMNAHGRRPRRPRPRTALLGIRAPHRPTPRSSGIHSHDRAPRARLQQQPPPPPAADDRPPRPALP